MGDNQGRGTHMGENQGRGAQMGENQERGAQMGDALCEKAKGAKLPGERRKNSMSEATRIAKAQAAGGTAPLIPHACPSHRHQRHRTGAHLPVVAGQA